MSDFKIPIVVYEVDDSNTVSSFDGSGWDRLRKSNFRASCVMNQSFEAFGTTEEEAVVNLHLIIRNTILNRAKPGSINVHQLDLYELVVESIMEL